MPTDPITRLNAALEGRYHIERELGEGGMATVYLADDRKHERKVALKVLKPELTAVVGAERFLAEIKTTANLQHPHILPLFDSGEAGGSLYYVMPYVEGESLRDRLDREKQLPVDEAVRLATDVAEALHAAHEQGVIHRDIKPANILLSRGRPLVADFGIALALSAAGGGRLTETGLSLGTPHYMSPEQATGDQMIGPAADTYALGCVLYEMLIGEPPYTGSTAQAILGQIITHEPRSAVDHRTSVPANVDSTIRRALEKLPADRFRDGREFARALADRAFRHGEFAVGAVGVGAGLWRMVAMGLGATTIVLGGLLIWTLGQESEGPPRTVERLLSPFPIGQEPRSDVQLSPDGSMFVYRAGGQLLLRRWEEEAAAPVPGTADGEDPAISPDGRDLAFVQGREVRVVPTAGGPVATWTEGSHPRWGPDGVLYATIEGGIARVATAGATPEHLTNPADSLEVHSLTDILPGNTHGLAMVDPPGSRNEEVHLIDLETGDLMPLGPGARPRFVETGHIVFERPDGELYAARLDVRAPSLEGAELVVSDVADWTVSRGGRLMFVSRANPRAHHPVQVDRTGRWVEIAPGWDTGAQTNTATLSLSPAGDRLAVTTYDGDQWHIWIADIASGGRDRLTEVDGFRPSWFAGGDSVLFMSERRVDERALYARAANFTGDARRVLGRPDVQQGEYAANGSLVLRAGSPQPGIGFEPGLVIVSPSDSVGVAVMVSDGSWEWDPAPSPDGSWIAYTANPSGVAEVFVRALADVDQSPRVRVSGSGGGSEPRWARDAGELFYRNASGEMVAVAYSVVEDEFTVDRRTPLFDARPYAATATVHAYDVSADGQTFYMLRLGGDEEELQRVRLWNNFDAELQRLLPN